MNKFKKQVYILTVVVAILFASWCFFYIQTIKGMVDLIE